jgi:hypothetical protein
MAAQQQEKLDRFVLVAKDQRLDGEAKTVIVTKEPKKPAVLRKRSRPKLYVPRVDKRTKRWPYPEGAPGQPRISQYMLNLGQDGKE